MKHRALTGLVASSVGLLLILGFACVDADIPTVSNRLRNGVEDVYANGGAAVVGAAGDGGSASTPLAGAGGDDGGDPPVDPNDDPSGGAAGSSMASAGAGGGAGAGGDDGAAGAGPAPGDVCNGFEILQTNCSGSACHSAPGAPLGDFAASEEAAREIVGQATAVSCAGQGDFIDPDSPEDSLVVLKMSGDPPCGQQMPPSGTPLSDADVECVTEWIGSL